jgi:hypothetical protein
MLVCVFLSTFAHETAGAARTRSSLRPLVFGANEFAKLGRKLSREHEAMSRTMNVIAAEEDWIASSQVLLAMTNSNEWAA